MSDNNKMKTRDAGRDDSRQEQTYAKDPVVEDNGKFVELEGWAATDLFLGLS